MKKGPTDWNHAAGISPFGTMLPSHPPTARCVFCWAKTLSDDPACSKASQKNATKNTTMMIARTRSFSSFVSGAAAACRPASDSPWDMGRMPVSPRYFLRSSTKQSTPSTMPTPAAPKP